MPYTPTAMAPRSARPRKRKQNSESTDGAAESEPSGKRPRRKKQKAPSSPSAEAAPAPTSTLADLIALASKRHLTSAATDVRAHACFAFVVLR